MPLTITPAHDTASLDEVRRIFEAYAQWIERTLGYSLAIQSFAAEMQSLPGRYEAPGGEILLARQDGVAAGAIAFYPLNGPIAELKRFYVMPDMAGKGIGNALFAAILSTAKSRGYTHVRLDTLTGMTHARRLYARYGFREIAPYNEHYKDSPDLLYYECDLADFA